MGLIFQIVGVLMVLFFFFLTYMCTKSWRAFHVVALFFVFFAAISSAIFAAMVMKTQKAWRSTHARLESQLQQVEKEGEQLLLGDTNVVRDWQEENTDSFLTARSALNRFLMDGGRIWRHCTKTNVAGETVTLNTVPPNTPQGEERPNRIVEKMVLYAFLENASPDGLPDPVPVFYLGEFQATNVTDTSVTLQPLRPLKPEILQGVQQSNATWSLHEMMPLDSHVVFPDTQPDDEHLFGKVDEQKLRNVWMPNPGLPDEQYNELVAEILKDGTKATPEDEVRTPERIWIRVKFLKNHEVEVDSGDVQGVLLTSYFDRNGRAIVQRLRRGAPDSPETAEFEIDDIAVFDKQTAEDLIAQGVAEKMEPYYVRKLNDYEYEFHQIASRMQGLDEVIRNVQRDTVHITKADELTNEEIRYRQRERANLEQDLAGFRREQQVVSEYAGQLQTRWESMRQEMSRMYQENLQMARELERLNRTLTEEIDKRTANATASLP